MNDNNTWVKLYRKILNNDLMADPTALQIFVWLLVNVDRKTGSTTVGRFWTSKELGQKPTTFYKALKRLENKYKIITTVTKKVTIKYTEVSLSNWAKYQTGKGDDNKDGNNSVTIKGQSSNNPVTHIQEVENKEYKNNTNASKKNRKKTIEEQKTSKNSITPCTDAELWEIANDLSVSIKDVKYTHASIYDKIEANEFKHKTVFHTCRNWVRLGIQRGTIKVIYKTPQAIVPKATEIPEPTPEEREASLAKAAEIRKQVHSGFSMRKVGS